MPLPLTEFQATVHEVKTLADGGLRVVLDLPETAIDAAAELMGAKRLETPLVVTCQVDRPAIAGSAAHG